MKDINKSLGSNLVLQDVSLELREGEVPALLGEGGAGKPTSMKILGGVYTKDPGEIFIQGQAAGINSVDETREFGISIIHQELMLVKGLSTAENIFMGNKPCVEGDFLSLKSQTQAAQEKLGQYNLGLDVGEILGHLIIAQQQVVEIVRVVSFGAKIIVADEPTSSLSSHEVGTLFDVVRKLWSEGAGTIYMFRWLNELYEMTDQVAVLHDGMNVNTVVTKEMERSQLVAMVVGHELSSYYIKNNRASDQVVFRALHLSDGRVIGDVSSDLYQGGILGLAGLVGAGRGGTMECIFGLRKRTGGTVWTNGKWADFSTAGKAIEAGIGFVPGDRKGAGLFLEQDVQFNATITILDQLFHRLEYNGKREIGIVDGMIRDIQIEVTERNQVVGDLSSDSQQKVLIGKWLLSAKQILTLNEPTRGVDVKTKAEIYSSVNDLARNELSIIIVSSESSELTSISDRIVTLCRGYSTGVTSREEFNREWVMILAATEVGTIQEAVMKSTEVRSIRRDSSSEIIQMVKGNLGILIGLTIMYIALTMTTDSFATTRNIFSVMRQISVNVLLACGMIMIILIGGTDLSVGSIIAISGCLSAGLITDSGTLPVAAIILAIAISTTVRAANGVIISNTKIPPFIVALVMVNIGRGFAYIYIKATTILVDDNLSIWIGSGEIFGSIPIQIVFATMVVVITAIILNRAKFERSIYAVGDNRQAAEYGGTNTKRTTLRIFTLSGLFVSCAGVLSAARTLSGQFSVGDGAEMDAISTVVLRGTSMTGGVGRISGTIIGRLAIGVLNNGMSLLGIDSPWQYVVKGLVVLLAVYIDYIRKEKNKG